MARVQQRIMDRFFGEQPVGTALSGLLNGAEPTGHF